MLKRIRDFLSSRYLYLLSSIICYFLSSAMFVGDHYSTPVLGILFSLIILFCLKIAISDRRLIGLLILLDIISLAGNAYIEFIEPSLFACVSHCIINIIFLSIITSAVIYSVTEHKTISADTLLGAICGYLLLGFTWTFIYLLIMTLDPHAFSNNSVSTIFTHRVQDFIYFSFSSITTTGYGDILAVSSSARAWSWLEAMVGQIYLAVWISQLVGLHIVQKMRS